MIMSCVTGGSFSVLWNGEVLEAFKPKGGLRQGDPISPYLFVLCMERLSNMIVGRNMDKEWVGIKASREGPSITHLFFADDLMLFSKADENVRLLRTRWRNFVISLDKRSTFKSLSFFSLLTYPEVKLLL